MVTYPGPWIKRPPKVLFNKWNIVKVAKKFSPVSITTRISFIEIIVMYFMKLVLLEILHI